jgi:hypothetical protein
MFHTHTEPPAKLQELQAEEPSISPPLSICSAELDQYLPIYTCINVVSPILTSTLLCFKKLSTMNPEREREREKERERERNKKQKKNQSLYMLYMINNSVHIVQHLPQVVQPFCQGQHKGCRYYSEI